MGPTGNLERSYKFLSLATRKMVTRRKFTEMPITESVIEQVEMMAVKDGTTKGLSFRNRKVVKYEFDNDENTRCWWNQKILHLAQTSVPKHREC